MPEGLRKALDGIRKALPRMKKRVPPEVQKIVVGPEIYRSNQHIAAFLGNSKLQARLRKFFGLHFELSQEHGRSTGEKTGGKFLEGEWFRKSGFPGRIIEIKNLGKIGFIDAKSIEILGTTFNVRFRLPDGAIVFATESFDRSYLQFVYPNGRKESRRR